MSQCMSVALPDIADIDIKLDLRHSAGEADLTKLSSLYEHAVDHAMRN